MEIKQNLTPHNLTVKTKRDIKYIVIHFTSNNDDTAYGNTRYFATSKLSSSAHYFVDENEIWQSVSDKDVAWHCGTNGTYYHKECRNANSIGIELCSRIKDGRYYFMDNTINNSVQLVKSLMERYNVPIGNVIRHFDVTHKTCPEPFVRDGQAWTDFRKRVMEEIIMAAFKDTGGHWADKHIQKLKDYGIVNGRDNGNFDPDVPITRAEVAVIVANALTSCSK